MKIKRILILQLVVLLLTSVGCEKKPNRVTRPKQTEAERRKIHTAMAKLEKARPQYVEEARERAANTPLKVLCPECKVNDLNVYFILPPLPTDTRHINITDDGLGVLDPLIGCDVYAGCVCGHVAYFTIHGGSDKSGGN